MLFFRLDLGVRLPVEARAREKVMLKFRAIFYCFDAQESEREKDGDTHEIDLPALITSLAPVNGKGHGQTARKQNDRIGGSPAYIQVLMRLDEYLLIEI